MRRFFYPTRGDTFHFHSIPSLDLSKNRNNWIGPVIRGRGKKRKNKYKEKECKCQNLLKATRDLSARPTSTYVCSDLETGGISDEK